MFLILCFVYSLLAIVGVTLIKVEILKHNLQNGPDFLRFLLTWRVVTGFLVIFLSALIQIKLLSIWRFSHVIPATMGIYFILTILVGILIFNDKLTLIYFFGFMLILSGILVISLISK